MHCVNFDNDSPRTDSDPQPTDIDFGTVVDVESSIEHLAASSDTENVKGDDTGTGTDTRTSKEHIFWSFILGEESNGSSEESRSQKEISVVANDEKKLEANNEWWHSNNWCDRERKRCF